jgi:hypothetical protein
MEVLQACIERGSVHVTFAGTRGGTELTVPLDKTRATSVKPRSVCRRAVSGSLARSR